MKNTKYNINQQAYQWAKVKTILSGIEKEPDRTLLRLSCDIIPDFISRMSDSKRQRFESAFDSPSVKIMTLKDVIFVLVNSMALEGDGCNVCKAAEEELKNIKYLLKCSKVKCSQML